MAVAFLVQNQRILHLDSYIPSGGEYGAKENKEMGVDEKTKGTGEQEHPQTGPDVTVTVDTLPKTVHRGSVIVADFKKEVGVDPNRALDEVIAGEFKPLQDDQRITIKGNEVFVSHVRQGGSS